METSANTAAAFSKKLMNVEDIDANDKDNPQLVSEYVNDIYSYMRSLEVGSLCIILLSALKLDIITFLRCDKNGFNFVIHLLGCVLPPIEVI